MEMTRDAAVNPEGCSGENLAPDERAPAVRGEWIVQWGGLGMLVHQRGQRLMWAAENDAPEHVVNVLTPRCGRAQRRRLGGCIIVALFSTALLFWGAAELVTIHADDAFYGYVGEALGLMGVFAAILTVALCSCAGMTCVEEPGPTANYHASDDCLTPLHVAAACGSCQVITVLVDDFHADIDARDYMQRTPLHHAALQGEGSSILSLTKRGASVLAKDIDGCTPFDLWVDWRQTQQRRGSIAAENWAGVSGPAEDELLRAFGDSVSCSPAVPGQGKSSLWGGRKSGFAGLIPARPGATVLRKRRG